jgi:streptogramin lyase
MLIGLPGAQGGLVASADTLSGWTCSLTVFRYTVDSVPNHISNDKFVWDLGDGTRTVGISTAHVYNFPGKYTVSLVCYSSAGEEYLSTETKQISVSDIFPDNIIRVTDNTFNITFVPAGKISTSNSVPITLNRYSSWQTHKALSATDTAHTIVFGASGSSSNKLDINDYVDNKWNHTDLTWSFYNQVTATDFTVSYEPVDRIETSDELIYYQPVILWNNDTNVWQEIFRHIPTSTIDTLSSTTLVGTSGKCVTYYADDQPGQVYATFRPDISRLLDRDSIIDNTTPVYLSDIQYYSHGTQLTLPIKVTQTIPSRLMFTSCGVPSMAISQNKWQNTRVPFFINLSTASGSVVLSYPSMSILPTTPGQSPSTDTSVVNLSVISQSNTSLSAHFFKINDGQLPTSLAGSYRGMLIPIDIGENVKLTGQTSINIPAGFTKHVYFGFLGNSDFDTIYRVTSYDELAVDGDTGLMVYKWGKTSTSPATASETFAFATVPPTDVEHDLSVLAHASTDNAGTLSSFNTLGTPISSIDLKSITLGFGALSGTIINMLDKTTGDTNNLTPSCMAISKNRDLWLTLPDNNLIVKLSPNTSQVMNYFSKTGNRSIPISSGGGYLYEPGIIDTDKDDNIWVAYTQTLSSFITKYSPAGAELVTYEFPQYIVPQDIVVDRTGNVWVATVNQSRVARDTITAPVYGDIATSGHFCYYIGTGSGQGGIAGQNPTVSTWQVGEILDIEYPSDSLWPQSRLNYSDKFLITSSELLTDYRYKVCVQPYTGRYNSTVSVVSACMSFGVKSSDKVYKFDSTGSVVHTVSGFNRPTYIVIDENQDCWVSHDVNTVTKIDTTSGIKTETARVETSEFLTLCSANFNAAQYNVQQGGGISCNTSSKLLVINSSENRVFNLSVNTPSASAFTVIDNVSGGTGSNMYRAFGDWTSWRWVNKYAYRDSGTVSLSGQTTFNVFTSGGKHKVAVLHEDFDAADTIKSYRFQPQLLDDATLFDTFYGQIVGTSTDEPTSLGKTVYRNIANFSTYHADVHECNINALYSLADQYNVSITNYNHGYIGGLQRIMNICSVPHYKLWGHRSKFGLDFNKEGTTNPTIGINLGSEISPLTATIVAGTRIVAEQLFNGEFKIINPMYLSGASTQPGYAANVKMLSSYPLSAYSPNWGWGLRNNTSGMDIVKYYNFYEYNSVYNDVQLEGVIDWYNPYTNLTETNSGIEAWTGNDGIVDIMIDYELRKGLNLFMPAASGSSSELQ